MTCRVLKIARALSYRWLEQPVTPSDLEQAYRANALFDAHKDDPEFGYRLLIDEARRRRADGGADRVADLLGGPLVERVGKPGKKKKKKKLGREAQARSRTSTPTGSWATRSTPE